MTFDDVVRARGAHTRIRNKAVLAGVSATAMCVFALSSPAYAQTGAASGQNTAGTAPSVNTPGADPAAQQGTDTPASDAAGADDVVVTGIRQSLANAQTIKRNSDTVVDAITAQDIGALPDRSVTEALQRVPGVSINRFAGNNDPDHFSVEGSGVNVRGLNFVRSEFNGRDTFSAGIGGQAINFADVPSELLGSVEVYKNATADLVEGGLAGTVNLNTRKPFDNKGFHIGGGVEANYGDFAKKWAPTGSLLVSNTWETPIGRFGILANASYSQLKSRADGIQVTNFQTRDGVQAATGTGTNTTVTCRNQLPGSTDANSLLPGTITGVGDASFPNPANVCGSAGVPGADGFADPTGIAYAPIGGQFRSQDYNRKRDGQALAVQWQSTDERTTFTAQFLRTHSSNAWGEHTFETAPDLSEYSTYPAGCQQNSNGPLNGAGNTTTRAECQLNGSGQFAFGNNQRGNGYNPTGGAYPNYVYDSNGLFQSGFITLPGAGWRTASSGSATTTVPSGGTQQSLSRRQVYDENLVKDAGFNLKINPDDHWSIGLDVDYTSAKHDVTDLSVFGSTFADTELDLTGNLPVVIPHKPLTLAANWATPNPAMAAATDSQYFGGRDFQFWRAAMDHIEQSVGEEYQVKGDFAYKFDDGDFLQRVKFGARYAERSQDVRYTAYNWGAISEIWSGAPVTFNQGDTSRSSLYSFDNFYRGQTNAPPSAYYYNGDLINGYNSATSFFQTQNDIWRNTNGATATNRFLAAGQRAGAIPGSAFLPSEVSNVRQMDTAAYAMLQFGSSEPLFGDIRVSGNVGLRYVRTTVNSRTETAVPNRTELGVVDPFATRCVATSRQLPDGTTQVTQPGGVCNLGATEYERLRTFATDGYASQPAFFTNSYGYFLPSANLKLGVTRDVIVRLAGSKVLTRPDFANIRPYVTYALEPGSGTVTINAGNPYLRPATAWQFDATVEWYFARVGQLSIDAFYKTVDGFFYQSLVNRSITNNGITQNIQARGPANFSGKGKIRGFEVAYQQTFDFLPGFLNGLGFNGNYTFIDSSGLPNSFLNGGTPSSGSTIAKGNLPLEGLSKHNFNATAFYEKGPISLRAAYNWRSRFLLTAADVIFPYTSIFNDQTGQLDASAFININRYVKLGVQGVNLTNTTTKLLQAYKGGSDDLAPRSYFTNDRRFSIILRANY
ncbi:TonB-dependent receptor [Sphingomonas sp. Leaf231]|uniref:TonB-dependent receptor n=1 Tax=Sphingomonas sp. Leaf231 TaxID=1736301 RepID=UPI0006F495B0|nr:TonB-dependent receptor [Sphingomonas sp. Leaf231]KQN92996.1 TonB-dependent receptor [Sphingomonas sp. Leaf231]